MDRILRHLPIALLIGTCAMVPAGAIAQQLPAVGEVPVPEQVRPIPNPGVVGLGPDLPGSVYAIVSGHLVRIQTGSGKILSILRPIPD